MSACPVCETLIKPRFVKKYGDYTMSQCPQCGVVYSDPMKNPGAQWYEDTVSYAVYRVLDHGLGWHHRQFLDDPERYGEKLLDVGCGLGVFLSKARDKGYKVWGMDYNKEEIAIAKERYGLENVSVMDVGGLSKTFTDDRFDVITLFEVLEHLDDPPGFLRQVKGVLKQGGYLAVSVPNLDRTFSWLDREDYPPHHLTRWNARSLGRFLEKNGFEVVKRSIKRIDAAGFLKARVNFGTAQSLAKKGMESGDVAKIRRAELIIRLKDAVFDVLSLPLRAIFSVVPFQGRGLYVLARLR